MLLRCSRLSSTTAVLIFATVLLLLCVGLALGAADGESSSGKSSSKTGAGGNSTGSGGSGGSAKPKSKPKTAAVVALVITPINAVVPFGAPNATLQCANASVIAWYQNRTGKILTNDVMMLDGKTPKYVIVGSSLTIVKPGKEDIGVYTCYDANTKINYATQLMMIPFVDKFNKGKTINMAEGETLTLLCATFGWPPPTVKWGFVSPLNPTAMIPVSANLSVIPGQVTVNGSLLVINPVIRQNYGMYTCFSANAVGASNSTVAISVKGKLTSLWFFFAIVIEVTILIVIIIVYEKKAAKEIARQQALLVDDEKLTKATQRKAKEDVRQRK